MKKALLLSFPLLIALAVIAFAAYDLTQFQTHRRDITSILEGASPQDRDPPDAVVRMLNASLQIDPSNYASRLLVDQFMPAHRSAFCSQLTWALWRALVILHLSKQEQTTIILALAPTGKGRHGVSSTAIAVYGRQPSELSLSETATVVALTQAPSAQGERLQRIRDRLLSRYDSSRPE